MFQFEGAWTFVWGAKPTKDLPWRRDWHRPDDYIGFTPSCPPTFYKKIVPMVGTRNFNKPTDLCKFKSSQKDISRPVGRFLEIFYSTSRGFDY